MNRSFWTAGTSSGFVTNKPAMKWTTDNTAETLFDRLEAHGRTWKVYVLESVRISFTGWIHMPRLKDRLATNFVPFSEFERDAASGTLPDFCLIEPHLIAGHGDYHPAEGRSLIGENVNLAFDPPSSILAGENFLNRIYHRHTSLLSTLRKVWDLGGPFTDRDAAARTFEHLLSRESPRDSASWPDFQPRPVPEWQLTQVELGEVLSNLGKAIGPGFLEHAQQSGLSVPAELTDPNKPPTPQQIVDFVFGIASNYFPRLIPDESKGPQSY